MGHLYPVYRVEDGPLAGKRGLSRERCATDRSSFVGAPLGRVQLESSICTVRAVPKPIHELDQPPSESFFF